jgi:hypothetical protein
MRNIPPARRPPARRPPARRPALLLASLPIAVSGALCGLGAGAAAAAELTTIPCGLVDDGTIHIDGLLSDWEGYSPITLKSTLPPGQSGRSLQVKVSCNFDPKNVYLLVDVDDDILMRTRAAAAEEDHLELAFGTIGKSGDVERIDKLTIWPGVARDKLARTVRWQGKGPHVVDGEGPAGRQKPLKGAPVFEVFDSLQPRGYAIELRLPKKAIPGFREGAPLRLAVRVVDSDGPGRDKQGYAESSPVDRPQSLSEVIFEDGDNSHSEIFGDLKVGRDDVYFEKTADVGSGVGKVMALGRFLAFVNKGYSYHELGRSRGDVKDLQLVQIADGQHAVAARVMERGQGGGREVLRLYRLQSGRFEPIFAAEVGKEQGAKRLQVKVDYVRRGKGTDIELSPLPAAGFTEASYTEMPAEDVAPILLPWQDKKVRWTFKNGRYTRD